MPPSENIENDNATRQLCITDLPNEIIARIFYAGTQSWSEGRTRAQELPFPLLVSGVSAHWRLLARSTPELWTFIVPPLHRDADFCTSETVDWLSRSKSLLVSVVFDARRRIGSAAQISTSLSKILVCIVHSNAISRLRRLDIFDDSAEIVAHLPVLRDAINLQQFSFCISGTHQPIIDIDSFLWEWSKGLPNLRKLRIEASFFPYIPNLTSLTVSRLRLSYQNAQVLFSASPNLTTLVLENLFPISLPPNSNLAPINAHSVRSIAVSCIGNDAVSVYMLSLLSLPSLVYLEVSGPLAMSISLVLGSSTSGAKIQSLRISNSTILRNSRSEDIRMFHSFTALRHLQIIQAPAATALFSNVPTALSRTQTRSIHLQNPPAVQGSHGNDLDSVIRYVDRQGAPASTNAAAVPVARSDIPWPDLRTISLDALAAADVAAVCEFVGEHKGVQVLELSKPSMRHLSESLRRHGDKINPLPWRATSKPEVGYSEGTKDVKEWLAARVHLGLLPSPNYGLLDSDHFSEMI
ncbi:hypothetical protein BJ912DRAFT_180076 [Pholiota molesta]|nr:hypothetical protein BJ912DRAFT_180076 [Pholiota molesta]